MVEALKAQVLPDDVARTAQSLEMGRLMLHSFSKYARYSVQPSMDDTGGATGQQQVKRCIPECFTLRGTRVKLISPPTPQDDPVVRDILSDPTNMKFLQVLVHAPNGWTEEEARERRVNQAKAQREDKGLYFSMYTLGGEGDVVPASVSGEGGCGVEECGRREREGCKMVGLCGFRSLDMEKREGEIGIIVHHENWGQGLANEALLMLMQYAFEELHLHRCHAATNPGNTRMRAVFDKFGIKMVSETIRVDSGHQWVDYAVHDHEWPGVKEKMLSSLARFK